MSHAIGTPKPLIALCALLVAMTVLQAFWNNLGAVGQLLWAAILAVLSMNAITGGRKSAFALKCIAYVFAALSVLSLLFMARSPLAYLVLCLSGLLYATLAIYLTTRKDIKAFYAAK